MKIRLEILQKLSAWQTICAKFQALFSLKKKKKKKKNYFRVSSAIILNGALRVTEMLISLNYFC